MSYAAHDLNDTIIALATPPGIGAIGVIRLSGKKAISLVNQVFKGKNLEKQAGHTVHFGTIRTDDDRILDEVLVTLFVAPRSFTGEDSVEISCHGSTYILQQVLELLIKKGARLAQPGEFTMRAFLNGRMDLSQAEAVADLIAADSASSHTLALQQMRGGISQEIQQLRQELLDFASLIELELDFAEEDVEFANRDNLKTLVQKIQGIIRTLLQSFQLGNALKNGISTVIAGRPNAGKSTLLNALLQEERAIVSDIPGTTRDTIEEVLNIKGVQFRLIDTAGIREAQDQIEAVGVAKTYEKVAQATLLLYVYDIIETKIDEVLQDLQQLQRPELQILVVCNKMDKFPNYDPNWLKNPTDSEIPKYFFSPNAQPATRNSNQLTTNNEQLTTDNQQLTIITAAALHHMNIPYLKDKLYELVLDENLQLESTIVSNARHYEALQKALTSLDDVRDGMDSGITSDFIAMDIRQAIHHLGSITGEISTDDLLGNIFGRFCIGK